MPTDTLPFCTSLMKAMCRAQGHAALLHLSHEGDVPWRHTHTHAREAFYGSNVLPPPLSLRSPTSISALCALWQQHSLTLSEIPYLYLSTCALWQQHSLTLSEIPYLYLSTCALWQQHSLTLSEIPYLYLSTLYPVAAALPDTHSQEGERERTFLKRVSCRNQSPMAAAAFSPHPYTSCSMAAIYSPSPRTLLLSPAHPTHHTWCFMAASIVYYAPTSPPPQPITPGALRQQLLL